MVQMRGGGGERSGHDGGDNLAGRGTELAIRSGVSWAARYECNHLDGPSRQADDRETMHRSDEGGGMSRSSTGRHATSRE